ncbi:mCG146358, isoform CRA_a [Mus musculus]|nr:mCG146358, isoform CRA_a [Mus musculus]EDL34705.1 mCG146358, isoform CRA_a [Mus musculus]EDL34706.1 mCG146358, isoform CRA_a [Mus musculus]
MPASRPVGGLAHRFGKCKPSSAPYLAPPALQQLRPRSEKIGQQLHPSHTRSPEPWGNAVPITARSARHFAEEETAV